MMFNRRLTRTAAVAVAIAAIGAPAASAEPAANPLSVDELPAFPSPVVEASQDLRSPDTRDHADGRGTFSVTSDVPARDLRNPDTRDYAEGRGTYNSPEVVVVESPSPVTQPTAGGIDWEDVGMGAGALLAIALLGAGGALAVVHRRGARQLAS
jgi:hypothetical protein